MGDKTFGGALMAAAAPALQFQAASLLEKAAQKREDNIARVAREHDVNLANIRETASTKRSEASNKVSTDNAKLSAQTSTSNAQLGADTSTANAQLAAQTSTANNAANINANKNATDEARTYKEGRVNVGTYKGNPITVAEKAKLPITEQAKVISVNQSAIDQAVAIKTAEVDFADTQREKNYSNLVASEAFGKLPQSTQDLVHATNSLGLTVDAKTLQNLKTGKTGTTADMIKEVHDRMAGDPTYDNLSPSMKLAYDIARATEAKNGTASAQKSITSDNIPAAYKKWAEGGKKLEDLERLDIDTLRLLSEEGKKYKDVGTTGPTGMLQGLKEPEIVEVPGLVSEATKGTPTKGRQAIEFLQNIFGSRDDDGKVSARQMQAADIYK